MKKALDKIKGGVYNIIKEGRDVVAPALSYLKITANVRYTGQLFFIVLEKIENKNEHSDNVTDKCQKLN